MVIEIERTTHEALDVSERPVLVILRGEDAAPSAEKRRDRIGRLRRRSERQRSERADERTDERGAPTIGA